MKTLAGSPKVRIASLRDDPALATVVRRMHESPPSDPRGLRISDTQRWPKYEVESAGSGFLEGSVDRFAEFQLAATDVDSGELLGCALSVPFLWDRSLDDLPRGWDEVLVRGVQQAKVGIVPNTLAALSITVAPQHQGRGLSGRLLECLRELARTHQFGHVLAPVRPVLKMKYPLVPIEEYVTWRDKEGKVFDPWLRLHHEAGGRFLAVAPESVIVEGSVQDWEEWTGLQFPASRDYVVPAALSVVSIDLHRNRGVYRQPNVWMAHSITEEGLGMPDFPVNSTEIAHA